MSSSELTRATSPGASRPGSSSTATERERARLAALISALQAAVLLEDESRRIVLANASFCAMFGVPVPPEALIGMDCSRSAEEAAPLFVDPETFVARIRALLEARAVVVGEVLELRDGRHLERDYVPVFSGGEYVGHLWMYRDVTERVRTERTLAAQAIELERANEVLSALANRDALTGIANRRALMSRLDAAVASDAELTVMLVDLDHFKNVNDRFGHAAGDDVLRAVARVLVENVRSEDLVARFGGEELVVLLPGTSRAVAERIAERCRAAVESMRGLAAPVTVSIGLAPLGRVVSDALGRADAALYESKRRGRNRVTHTDDV